MCAIKALPAIRAWREAKSGMGKLRSATEMLLAFISKYRPATPCGSLLR